MRCYNFAMRHAQWSLTFRPGQEPSQKTLYSEKISAISRAMAGFAGLLGAISAWDLLVRPYGLPNMPLFEAFGLPFVILSLICVSLMLVGFAYALLAVCHDIRIDQNHATLSAVLHLRLACAIVWKVPLSRIKRLWIERSTFHEHRETWEIKIAVQHMRFPKHLQNFDTLAEAEIAARTYRNAIEAVTGVKVPD